MEISCDCVLINELLTIACEKCNLDIIKFLVKKDGKIDNVNDIFSRACIYDNYELIRYLIENNYKY